MESLVRVSFSKLLRTQTFTPDVRLPSCSLSDNFTTKLHFDILLFACSSFSLTKKNAREFCFKKFLTWDEISNSFCGMPSVVPSYFSTIFHALSRTQSLSSLHFLKSSSFHYIISCLTITSCSTLDNLKALSLRYWLQPDHVSLFCYLSHRRSFFCFLCYFFFLIWTSSLSHISHLKLQNWNSSNLFNIIDSKFFHWNSTTTEHTFLHPRHRPWVSWR